MDQHADLTTLAGTLRAQVDGLRGISGVLAIDVDGRRAGTLAVDDGTAAFVPDGLRACAATIRFGDPSDVRALLGGELHPVVAVLQRRMEIEGDRLLGARVALGLHAGAEFTPVDRAPET